MTSFAERLAEDRRLAILKALAQMPGYQANEGVLRTALDHVGLRVGRDAVRADLTWMEDFRLVRIERLPAHGAELWVATLTGSGDDVAHGRVKHHGIPRPEVL